MHSKTKQYDMKKNMLYNNFLWSYKLTVLKVQH
jgi:hypothetical protein